MEEVILNFPKQFEWEPHIQNSGQLERRKILIVAGMGGSHLAADIVQAWNPALDIIVHSDYRLYGIPESVLQNSLIVANSYSGNTEETVSAFKEGVSRHIPVSAIGIGGKLLDLAKQYNVPYIQIPDTGIQPRMALGFTLKALAAMAGLDDLAKKAGKLALLLKPEEFKKQGEELAKKLQKKIPVIYASKKNYAVAYNWKIKFNETGKIPAFYNVFPELNHNEMAGFDVRESTKNLSEQFHFIFLKDSKDDERIQKRMEVSQKMYAERGFPVEIIDLKGSSKLERIFSSLLLADWTAYYLAALHGVDPEQTLMIEEFKKLILQ